MGAVAAGLCLACCSHLAAAAEARMRVGAWQWNARAAAELRGIEADAIGSPVTPASQRSARGPPPPHVAARIAYVRLLW